MRIDVHGSPLTPRPRRSHRSFLEPWLSTPRRLGPRLEHPLRRHPRSLAGQQPLDDRLHAPRRAACRAGAACGSPLASGRAPSRAGPPRGGRGRLARVREKSVRVQHNPADGQHTSVDVQNTSVDGQNTSVHGQHTSVDVQHTSVDGQHTSVHDQHNSVDDQNTSVRGQKYAARERSARTGPQGGFVIGRCVLGRAGDVPSAARCPIPDAFFSPTRTPRRRPSGTPGSRRGSARRRRRGRRWGRRRRRRSGRSGSRRP